MITMNQPPKRFCDVQVRKVVQTVLTFDETDSEIWRNCARTYVDEACARRYLASRSWMASRAVMAITKTIQWRLALHLQLSESQQKGIYGQECTEWSWKGGKRPIRLSPARGVGGGPVVVLSARHWPEDDEDWLHMLIYALEETLECMKLGKIFPETEKHRSAEQGADTWTWVVDMEGTSLSDAPNLQALRKLDHLLFSHYPGRLEKVLFINMPVLLKISFALGEMLLDESSRQKMVVVDGSRVKLEDYIHPADMDNLFGIKKGREKLIAIEEPEPSSPRAMGGPFCSIFRCVT